MSSINEMIEELKKKRDEIRVQIDLGSKEAKSEFERLEKKLETVLAKASKDTQNELKKVGSEIESGFDKLRAALKKKD